MYCFKSTLTPTTLYFLSTFYDLHCISSRLLVTADFKSFPEFKMISYYFLYIKLLLNIELLQMCKCEKQRYNFHRIYIYV